eukprot:CAMPEP_0184227816 /NCGR_PEP_ID=MMETSP0976-20121227/21441_1 /TAXON_ID=483370 /ORGANISM="non described non described, Strain CCMP2097" /LENGTH=76 /DNA_ID=CAMNT_0026532765 /DNA_START=9 /DNA_END=236 /DNA_ORIENTATION=-
MSLLSSLGLAIYTDSEAEDDASVRADDAATISPGPAPPPREADTTGCELAEMDEGVLLLAGLAVARRDTPEPPEEA